MASKEQVRALLETRQNEACLEYFNFTTLLYTAQTHVTRTPCREMKTSNLPQAAGPQSPNYNAPQAFNGSSPGNANLPIGGFADAIQEHGVPRESIQLLGLCSKPGMSVAADTDAYMRAEILSYSRARGVFAGVSLEGSTLRPDNKANRELYGRSLTAEEIINGSEVRIPKAAHDLIAHLNQVSPERERRAS